LTGEAGNASRRKVIVEATARSLEWASAWRTQDESGPTFSRVIRTNFGDRMAKIFRENSDSLATPVSELYEQFHVAGFQISAEIKQHLTHYCINKSLAYVYDVIVKVKQMTAGELTLKSIYAIKMKEACHGEEFKLKKIGRIAWREFSIQS
jgi:uncharacterized membrane protein